MKICLTVTNDIVTDQRVNKIALSLCKLDAVVTIVGRRRKRSMDLKPSRVLFIRFRLLFNKGPLFYVCYNARLFFYLLFNKFDILIANDLDTLPANYLVSIIKRKILVYDSHEYFTEVPELEGRTFVKRIWERIEALILPRIKYAYTVCDSIANIYNKKYHTSMLTIRNLPYCSIENQTQQTGNKPSGKIIIYQGSVNLGRGIEPVIHAMKFIDNTKFYIVGDGDILDSLKRMVKDLGLDNKIVFTGRVTPDELINYSNLAHIGISLEENLGLNYYYALPNKLFDYIRANVPVLVSDFPEMGSIVKKYDIGITTLTRDPKELAELVKIMLTDNQKILKWKANLKIAAAELCWKNEEKKLLDFYKGIISPLQAKTF